LTIAVDEVNSQAGNLQTGDWVDLYYSRTEGAAASLIPLMQRVEVMATGSSLAGPSTQRSGREQHFGTITLGLSAADAARVLLAQQSGSVSVVLRAADDTSLTSWSRQSSHDLLSGNPQQTRGSGDSRVEVLVGGTGELVPQRSWLPLGKAVTQRAGEAS
jgi:pilus assembly protein CpaB